jgi:hypothetical protein
MGVQRSLLLGARDWEHSAWNMDFYPEDLPVDWRLSYYANEFQVVMVPATRWMESGPEELAQWREEVPQGFRFYLEVDDGGRIGAWVRRWGEPLCEVLASLACGLVVPDLVTAASVETACPGIPVYKPAQASGGAGDLFVRDGQAGAGAGALLCIDSRDLPDLRRLRTLVEELVSLPGQDQGPAALIYTGDQVSMGSLEEARTLLQLLGIA